MAFHIRQLLCNSFDGKNSTDFNIFCLKIKRELERRAAIMGGGNFVVPVQTVTDFLDSKLSGMVNLSLPEMFSR